MPTYNVDGIDFIFDGGWEAAKYDDWAFYRNQFQRIPGRKALDLIAFAPDKTVWLIEVKDYRTHPRTKPSALPDEIVEKVVDTLAALLPASIYANTLEEQVFAGKVLRGSNIRVLVHLEQPAKHSKLFPQVYRPADLKQRLRQLLKPIDAHPVVACINDMVHLPWRCERN